MSRYIIGCCAVVCLVISGCTSEPGLPEGATGTVSGKVTLDGKPLPDGMTVIFTPSKGGLPAIGKLGSDGSFSLKMKDGSDILVGEYGISVSAPVVEVDAAAAMEASMAGEEVAGTATVIPEKFLTPQSSKETFSVKEGANTYELDMKSSE